MQAEDQDQGTGFQELSRMTVGDVIEHYRNNDSFCGLKAFAFDVNGVLRQGGKLSNDQTEAVRLLDAAIAEAIASDADRVFFRGCSEEDYLKCELDGEFQSFSFLSLSSNPIEAASFAKSYDGEPSYFLMLLIPAGWPLLRISDHTVSSLEKDEWLPARGLRFRSCTWDGISGLKEEDAWIIQLQAPCAKYRRLEPIV